MLNIDYIRILSNKKKSRYVKFWKKLGKEEKINVTVNIVYNGRRNVTFESFLSPY